MHHVSHVAIIVSGIVMLLLIAAAILGITQRVKLPFTVALVLVGIGLVELADIFPEYLQPIHELEISPDLILYVFLPTLVFESTFNLDSRNLYRNLGPILILAVPGLLLSTAVIGFVVHWVTDIPLVATLLLGAILSATDPVAVVSIFKQLGAPERLTVLVEGESLFNDATSIVLAGILITIFSAGSVGSDIITGGIFNFFYLFIGGLVVGVLLGVITGYLLGMVESNPFIEISLTTALAYLSFLVAEELLHVSGVMSTVGAGLIMGGWGRLKISPSVQNYLAYFWEHLAFIANSLIFLMVGLTVALDSLVSAINILVWVVVAMILARAVIIFGLMPVVGKIPGSRVVSRAYQLVMFWGGLRGAIALAIVLSLPQSDYSELFEALVMGAVLFTLLLQGTTIESLVKYLGLNKLQLYDRLAVLEATVEARQRAYDRIPALRKGGLFSNQIASQLQHQCRHELRQAQQAMQDLRQQELDANSEVRFLYLRCFSREKQLYSKMFEQGHLSESAYRRLANLLRLQTDALRHHGEFEFIQSHRYLDLLVNTAIRIFSPFRWLQQKLELIKSSQIIRDYEQIWGHYQGSFHILEFLDQIGDIENIPHEILDPVRSHYQSWHQQAHGKLDLTNEHFPEFVRSMQQRLSRRMLLLAEAETIEEQAHQGVIPKGVGESKLQNIAGELHQLRGQSVQALADDPLKLLQRVPLFAELSFQDIQRINQKLITEYYAEDDIIIQQGEQGDSMFLVGRGVVRVQLDEDGTQRKLATLVAGEFFGEMALMHHEVRNASIVAVTPCKLFRLKQQDVESLMAEHDEIKQVIKLADENRSRSFRSEDN